jgi:hypothetical protein
MQLPHAVPELLSRPNGCDVNRQEMGSLTEGVYYYHDCIITIRLQKFNNKVDTYIVF